MSDRETTEQTIARRTLAQYGLEAGYRVRVELLTGDVRQGRLRPRAVEGTAFYATSDVLVVAAHDDEATSHRIPWAAIALISDATPQPHPAL